MSRLRLCFASFLFASAIGSTGCPSATTMPGISPKPPVVEVKLDRAAVRAKLAERRQVMFDRFLAYREGRVYPINELPGGGFRHVWVDNYGNLCAAATLISGDWGRDVTIRIGQTDNQLKLADVKTGPVADWILTSGLTHHEIVAIQVPGDDMFRRSIQTPEEIERLYQIYVDVERQLRGLADESLDAAVDALMKRPELAQQMLHDRIASPGPFAQPIG
jgi:hypothetical protein